MKANQFVNENKLRPADVIVLRKKVFGMVNHYAIYLGKDFRGKPEFVANFTKGVKKIPEDKIESQLETYIPERIEKFEGSSLERKDAIKRAKSKIGEEAYSYVANNCEHFKNWVHFGEQYSEQVDQVGTALTVGGATMAIGGLMASKPRVRNIGIGALLLGVALKSFAERKNKTND